MNNPSPVRLVPHTAEFADCVLRWRNDPDILGQLCSERAPTREEHEQWLARLDERRREFVVLDAGTSQPLGTASLSDVDARSGQAELGILIGEKSAWGRGIGRAAILALLKVAFDELVLHRVYLRVFPDNERALRLYASAGFVREGLLREAVRKDGRFRDLVVMSILDREWRASAP